MGLLHAGQTLNRRALLRISTMFRLHKLKVLLDESETE